MEHTIKKFIKKEKYTKISNIMLQDKTISFGARGLLSYILSLPKDWTLYISTLYNQSAAGRTVIDRYIKELQNSKHLLKIQCKNSRGLAVKGGIIWLAFDEVEEEEAILEQVLNWSYPEEVAMLTIYFENNITIKLNENLEKLKKKKIDIEKIIEEKVEEKYKKPLEKEKYKFLEKYKLSQMTTVNIRKNIKNLTEEKFKELYKKIAISKVNNFEGALYTALKGEWNTFSDVSTPKIGRSPSNKTYEPPRTKEKGKKDVFISKELKILKDEIKKLGKSQLQNMIYFKFLSDLIPLVKEEEIKKIVKKYNLKE